MDPVSFDIKTILFSLVFFLSTCQLSEPTSGRNDYQTGSDLQLIIPKDEPGDEKKYNAVTTKLTLVLLGQNSIYCYEGNEISKGSFYDYKDIRKVILNTKKKFSSASFVVLIKPTKKASYKSAVDILDEMTINHVDKFEMSNPSTEEIRMLQIKKPS